MTNRFPDFPTAFRVLNQTQWVGFSTLPRFKIWKILVAFLGHFPHGHHILQGAMHVKRQGLIECGALDFVGYHFIRDGTG